MLFLAFCLPLFSEIKAVFFDYGGVVVESDQTEFKQYLLDSLELSDEDLTRAIANYKLFTAKGGEAEEFWEAFAFEKQIDLDDAWFERLNQLQRDSFKLNEALIELIQALKKAGLKVALLSNMREDQAKIVRQTGHFDFFDPVLLSYKIGHSKPDLPVFDFAVSELKIPKDSCLLVDDKKQNTDAAIAFGMQGHLYQSVSALSQYLISQGIEIKP